MVGILFARGGNSEIGQLTFAHAGIRPMTMNCFADRLRRCPRLARQILAPYYDPTEEPR